MIKFPEMPAEDNWGSYGALPISPSAIKKAQMIRFIPLNFGGVLIDINDEEVTIEVSAEGEIQTVCWDRT